MSIISLELKGVQKLGGRIEPNERLLYIHNTLSTTNSINVWSPPKFSFGNFIDGI